MRLILLVCLVAFSPAAAAQVVLKADNNSGRDSVWVKRYAAGKNSWGIVGNHIPGTNGNIWFNAFPGASGKYKLELGAVTEPDGNSAYKVSVGGKQVASGNYPYSTGKLDCSASTLKVQYLALGTHTVNKGDKINLWGNAVYPCGSSHGQYTRWFEIKFTLVGSPPPQDAAPPPPQDAAPPPPKDAGPPVNKTKITSPQAGVALVEGKAVTLQGQGSGTLTWSYDANSDGKGPITIGTGSSVKLTVPTGVTGAKTLTLTLSAAAGKVSQQHKIVASGQNPDAAPPADSAVAADAPQVAADGPASQDQLAAGDGAASQQDATTQRAGASSDGCSVGGTPPALPALLVVGLALLLARRRRRCR